MNGVSVVRMRPPTGADWDESATARDVDGANVPSIARDLAGALRAYFAGDVVALAEPAQIDAWLRAAGVSGFRLDVLRTLFDVPRGVTLSYGELAELAGRPGAARAAGTACATNPLPVLVPCHRVVHAGARRGDVGSYGAATGSDYKRRLLELEDAPLVRPVARAGRA